MFVRLALRDLLVGSELQSGFVVGSVCRLEIPIYDIPVILDLLFACPEGFRFGERLLRLNVVRVQQGGSQH